MSSRLRSLGLAVGVALAVVAGLFGPKTPPPPPLPIALVASFDEALSLASAAADQKMVELEQRASTPPRRRGPQVCALLAQLDDQTWIACDASTRALDAAVANLAELSPRRRAAVLLCVDHHLAETRRDLACATDEHERDEYRTTWDRLWEVRSLITA